MTVKPQGHITTSSFPLPFHTLNLKAKPWESTSQTSGLPVNELAVGFSSDTDIKSRYRRLQRFFAGVCFDYDAVARLQMQLFDFPRQKYYLTLDRTNWQWGKTDINILTLGVVYKGSAIPVYWLVLNKQGNSNQRERIALMKRFISQFGRDGIQGILGDREFIGEQWWGWLKQQRIPYVMRMRENQLMLDHKGIQQAVLTRFRDLKRGQHRQLRKTCQISGQWVWLSAMRLEEGDLLLLASNRRYPDPFAVYRLRWEIEIYQPYCLHKSQVSVNRPFALWIHKSTVWVASSIELDGSFRPGLP